MALEELNTFLGLPAFIWFFVAIAIAVIFVILIAVHEVFIMTKFAKKARGLKRTRGQPAFIQENNVIRLFYSDGQLPEGLFHIAKSWFVRPQRPYLKGAQDRIRKVGRPPKMKEGELAEDKKQTDVLKPGEREALEEILTCPILEDTGKSVFIGSVGQPMLLNPATVAHANIPSIQEVLPVTFPQTILDALHEYSVLKGVKKGTRDQQKIIIYAIAGAVILGSLGIVVYLLTQHPAAISLLGLIK